MRNTKLASTKCVDSRDRIVGEQTFQDGLSHQACGARQSYGSCGHHVREEACSSADPLSQAVGAALRAA